MSQLERSFLKLDAFSWRVWQQKTEVNVKHMAFDVNQNVLIMSILDLQNVAD